MYEGLLKPIFFRFNPETVHDFMTNMGELMGKSPITRGIVRMMYGYRGGDISKTVDGVTYKTPFLLSAGFDYNGHLSRILPQIGLGAEEIGSITAKTCAGNPKPRLFRAPKSGSIIVNKGLANDGVEAIIKRLKNTPREKDFKYGISIARTNDSGSATNEEGINDFVYSFKRLNEEGVGDYYTLNISCPNAFGGELFTDPILLDQLLTEIKKIPCSKPIYAKMPINFSWDKFDALLKIIDKHGLQGVIIGNLNKDYSKLKDNNEAPVSYCGGISGQPCRQLSTDLIRKTRQAYGKRFTIIGVGGVNSWEAAKEKFDAGADLIQLITGIIYKGPGLVGELCRGYANTV